MRIYILALSLITLIIVSCAESSTPVFHKSHEASRQEVPFSDAVETEDLVFLTGQIGKDHKTGKLVEGGISAQTVKTIKNIEEVLQFHGLSLDDVVKCTVILSDINDFKAFNAEYVKFFKNKPARTTFAAAGLAANAKIEIDIIAAK